MAAGRHFAAAVRACFTDRESPSRKHPCSRIASHQEARKAPAALDGLPIVAIRGNSPAEAAAASAYRFQVEVATEDTIGRACGHPG